jgi:uncharacterized RDD family membrane protein YckC
MTSIPLAYESPLAPVNENGGSRRSHSLPRPSGSGPPPRFSFESPQPLCQNLPVQAEPIVEIPVQNPRRRLARLGDRIVATFLDGILLFPFFWLAGSCIGVWLGLYDNGNTSLNGGPALLALALFVFLWIAFYVIAEAWFRSTFGKHVMAIEVSSTLRTPITLSQSIIRNVLRPVDAIGFYLLGFIVAASSKQNQRIGDIVAQTIVCERRDERRMRALLWAGLFLASGVIADWLFMHFAGRFSN